MKMVSKLALSAALLAGMNATVLVAPAAAKKEAPAQQGPVLSPAARAAIVNAQTALKATPVDLAAAETAVAAAEAASKSDTELYYAQSLRLGLENLKTKGKPEADRIAVLGPLLDAIIANPTTPKEEVGIRLNEHGNFSIAAKKYAEAAQYYTRAKDAGYTDQDLMLNIGRSKIEAGDVNGGVADLGAAVKAQKAAGQKVPEDWYKYAIVRLYKINAPETDTWTRDWLTDYGTRENWRTAIYQFGLQGPNIAKYSKNRLDLYRLLWATKSLAGQKEYIDYADVALNSVGLPEEAKSALKEGFASGVIPAGNLTGTDLLKDATVKAAGNGTPEAKEKRAVAGADPDLARQAGDSYFATRNFAKSAEMYKLAETKGYPDKDRNNLHLGMALALAGNRDEAKLVLAKVAADPYLSIARLWTTFVVAPPSA